jgi:TetR/AcrR family transcriptional repressor of nem operon
VTTTADNIVTLADSLIRKKGFNAFSYADIAAVMDIRNSAVHYHFPSKSDLGRAVIAAEQRRVMDYRKSHETADGEQHLKHLINTFYDRSQQNAVCLMGALTPEFATFDPEMQQAVRQLCLDIQEWVAASLETARSTGALTFNGDAASRAALVISTLLASLLLARVENANLFPAMINQLLEDLGACWRVDDLRQII